MVDTHTGYQNVALLKTLSAQNVWSAFLEARVTVYVGYSNCIRADQSSVFTSRFWDDVTALHGIELEILGIESHNSIGSGERYHAPLRLIFRVIHSKYLKLSCKVALCLALKASNDTMGPNGLAPSTLVYGIKPAYPVVNARLPTQRKRTAAFEMSKREMTTATAETSIKQALRSKLPPAARYDIMPGDDVLVYRKKGKSGSIHIALYKSCRKKYTWNEKERGTTSTSQKLSRRLRSKGVESSSRYSKVGTV